MKYKIARTIDGVGFKNDFEVLAEFTARNNDAANRYAEENFPDLDWYILNVDGENING